MRLDNSEIETLMNYNIRIVIKKCFKIGSLSAFMSFDLYFYQENVSVPRKNVNFVARDRLHNKLQIIANFSLK